MIKLTFTLKDEYETDVFDKEFKSKRDADAYLEGFLLNRRHMYDIGVTIDVKWTVDADHVDQL